MVVENNLIEYRLKTLFDKLPKGSFFRLSKAQEICMTDEYLPQSATSITIILNLLIERKKIVRVRRGLYQKISDVYE